MTTVFDPAIVQETVQALNPSENALTTITSTFFKMQTRYMDELKRQIPVGAPLDVTTADRIIQLYDKVYTNFVFDILPFINERGFLFHCALLLPTCGSSLTRTPQALTSRQPNGSKFFKLALHAFTCSS